MELALLRSFLALAGQLHFGRTARLLNVRQPALRKRIRQLESEIGGQLFRRGRNGTRLTDVGGFLLDRAGELVRRADQFLDDMRRAAQFQEFQLRFGELLAAGPVLLDPGAVFLPGPAPYTLRT
jgi:DNA-binding transcriptional LysR family regulator